MNISTKTKNINEGDQSTQQQLADANKIMAALKRQIARLERSEQ